MVKVLRHCWVTHSKEGIDTLLGTNLGSQITQHLSDHVILPNLKEMRFLYNGKPTLADRDFQLLWKNPVLKRFVLNHDNGDSTTGFEWAIDLVNSSSCLESLSWENWDPEAPAAHIEYSRLHIQPVLTTLSLSASLVSHSALGWASKLPALERLVVSVTGGEPWDLSDPGSVKDPCVFESLIALDFCWSTDYRAEQLLEACRLSRLDQFKLRFRTWNFNHSSNQDQRKLYMFVSLLTEYCPTITKLSIEFGHIEHSKKGLMARLLTGFQPLRISWLSLSITPTGGEFTFKGFLQDIIPSWPKLEHLELQSTYHQSMSFQSVVDTIVHFPMLRLLSFDSMGGPWPEPRIDPSASSDLPLDLRCYFTGHRRTDPGAIKT